MPTLAAMLMSDAILKGSPDQSRDERGRYGSGGADKATDVANEATKAANDKASNRRAAGEHMSTMLANNSAAILARNNRADSNTVKYFRDRRDFHQKMSDMHEERATGVAKPALRIRNPERD